jgi:hypothetical protein
MATSLPAPEIKVIRPGDTTKTCPFTIVIVSNPVLESPQGSGTFVVDPITGDKAGFDACTAYINDSLFGGLPGQAEQFMNDPAIAPFVRVVSLFVAGLATVDVNSLVSEDSNRKSNLVMTRRTRFVPFLSAYGLSADVAFAITGSMTHKRASAYFTSDDDARGGVPFVLDGITYHHRYEYLIPGTVALPVDSKSLTAIHEFGHALSSYSNGKVVDLYVDDGPGLNSKSGRPIPGTFATYEGGILATDSTRDSIGYPATWTSYHCALHGVGYPAVMDNYWLGGSGANPEACEHDQITRQILRDRLLAKISRPCQA